MIDNTIPKNCMKYVGVLYITHEKKIINKGVIDAIKQHINDRGIKARRRKKNINQQIL